MVLNPLGPQWRTERYNMDNEWIQSETEHLFDLTRYQQPEGEPIDLRDQEYTPEQMATLRSHLSTMRKGIDLISAALAKAWQLDHTDEVWNDGNATWSVKRAKTKSIIDTDLFYDWLASKDAEQLARLVSATAVKVGGMTPAERETLLDESEIHDRLTITPKPNYL